MYLPFFVPVTNYFRIYLGDRIIIDYLSACDKLLPYLSRCPYIYPLVCNHFVHGVAGWYNSLGKISNSMLHLSRSSSVLIHDTVSIPNAVFARSSQPRQGSLSLLHRNSHKCSIQDSRTECVTKLVNMFEESSVDHSLQQPVSVQNMQN